MMPWLKQVTGTVSELSRELHRNHKDLTLRLATVAYTDYDQPADTRTRKLDFTRSVVSCRDMQLATVW